MYSLLLLSEQKINTTLNWKIYNKEYSTTTMFTLMTGTGVFCFRFYFAIKIGIVTRCLTELIVSPSSQSFTALCP